MSGSANLSFDGLLEKGTIVEVTSIGAICGLDENEYCIRTKCDYWDKEKSQCKRFIWVSVMHNGKYHTLIMPRDKAKDNEKLARYLQ